VYVVVSYMNRQHKDVGVSYMDGQHKERHFAHAFGVEHVLMIPNHFISLRVMWMTVVHH
jgi:hypothetical protein